MRISVFAAESNPAIDPPFIRKSRSYCETEVLARRARMLDEGNLAAGVQIIRGGGHAHSETRASSEQRGCLTAIESRLNSEYRGNRRSFHELSAEYERKLENHILKGRKGLPYSCAVIAAHVKVTLTT